RRTRRPRRPTSPRTSRPTRPTRRRTRRPLRASPSRATRPPRSRRTRRPRSRPIRRPTSPSPTTATDRRSAPRSRSLLRRAPGTSGSGPRAFPPGRRRFWHDPAVMSGRPTPPLVCRPHPVARPWGGTAAAAFADLPPASGSPIGEWWLLSTRADHATLVANAPFAEQPLADAVATDPERILGARFAGSERFPLLLKILDTAEPLAVQVHPCEGAPASGGAARPECKTETWYVLDARPGATYWVGLADGVTLESFFSAARRGVDPLPLLARREARRGAVVHLHA